MKSFLFSLGLSTVIVGLSSAQVVADDPEAVEIKLRYQAGKTYEMVTELSTNTEFDVGGEKMENDTVMTFVVDNKVSAIEGSEDLQLLMTYTRVAMVMDGIGDRMVYDSAVETEEGEDENPLETMGDLVGKKITMVMTPDMEIKEIDGLESLLEGTEQEGMDKESMLEINEEQVKQLSGMQYMAVMPGKPVKEGDEWPYSMEVVIPMMGDLEIVGTSTLREIGLVDGRLQAIVEMTAKGKVVIEEAEEGDEVQPAPEVGLVKKMDMKGEYVIDLVAGYVVTAALESDMVMTMNVGNGAAAMEMPVKSVAKSTTRIK